MKKFLSLYLLLLLGLILGWAAVEAIFFRHIDLRFEGVFSLIVVPALQAVVLRGVLGTSVLVPLSEARREFGTLRTRGAALFSLFVLADIAIVGLGWFMARHEFLGFIQPRSLQPLWSEGKGVAAAGGFAWLAWRSSKGRVAYSLLGVGLLGFSSDRLFPWLYRLPSALFPRSPKLSQWILSYGVLILVSMILLLKVSTRIGTASVAGRLGVELATGFYFVIAVIVVLSVYLRPELPYLARKAVQSGESWMMTSLLAAAGFALASRRT